jgi:hypothetical protein
VELLHALLVGIVPLVPLIPLLGRVISVFQVVSKSLTFFIDIDQSFQHERFCIFILFLFLFISGIGGIGGTNPY